MSTRRCGPLLVNQDRLSFPCGTVVRDEIWYVCAGLPLTPAENVLPIGIVIKSFNDPSQPGP
jgi:hypothetical protein